MSTCCFLFYPCIKTMLKQRHMHMLGTHYVLLYLLKLRWSKPNTYGSHAVVILTVSLVWHSYSEICRYLLLLNDFQTSSTPAYVLYYNRGSEDSLHMSEFFLLVATLWVRNLRWLLVQVVLKALLWCFALYFTPSVFFRRTLISLPVGFDPFVWRYSMQSSSSKFWFRRMSCSWPLHLHGFLQFWHFLAQSYYMVSKEMYMIVLWCFRVLFEIWKLWTPL